MIRKENSTSYIHKLGPLQIRKNKNRHNKTQITLFNIKKMNTMKRYKNLMWVFALMCNRKKVYLNDSY